MPGTKEIKRRISSVKNTKKITKAMELVSASKMKRAVNATLASRLYAEYSWDILVSITKNSDDVMHTFFSEDEKKLTTGKDLLILITSNRGLCGAYNAQIIKSVVSLLKTKNNSNEIDIIAIGKKGDVAMRRLGQNIVASFLDLPDNVSLLDINQISEMALDEYKKGKYDKILVGYTDYVSALSQKPNIKQILPVSKTDLKDFIDTLGAHRDIKKISTEHKTEYLFEGDKSKLIRTLAKKLTKMQIYQMLLESNASEQSARMLAMKNASDASGEMIDELTLVFNKARQANITREISEISAGMASVT